jgi:NADH-quinone oxidoreductase subunit I
MPVTLPDPKHGFRREQTWIERLYLPAILRGLWVTMRHFVRRNWTVRYPEQMPEVAPRFRGLHTLKRDESGRERCTACFLCAYVCPANAIHIEAAEAGPEERHLYAEEKYARVYEINMLRCIFCGFCEEACPCGAVYMGREWESSDTDLDHFIYGKDRLLEPEGSPLTFPE